MNHTPETHAEAQASVNPNRKPSCGWCVSTHIADIKCTCEEPCMDKDGKPVGWCARAEAVGDPFAVAFL